MLLFYAGSIIAALHLRAASPGDAVALFTALPGSGAEQALGEDACPAAWTHPAQVAR